MSESLQAIGSSCQITGESVRGRIRNERVRTVYERMYRGYLYRYMQVLYLRSTGGRRVLFWKTCSFRVLDFLAVGPRIGLSNTFSRVILDFKLSFEDLPKIFGQNESLRFHDSLIEWICSAQLSHLSNSNPMYLIASAQEWVHYLVKTA